MDEKLTYHQNFILENGYDIPEITDWEWKGLNK